MTENCKPENCRLCGHPLEFRGVQHCDCQGVDADLMHCVNPRCQEYQRTRCYHQRPMPPEVAAARRARLLEVAAQYGAGSLAK